MELSIREAATILGRNERTVRDYYISPQVTIPIFRSRWSALAFHRWGRALTVL